MGAGSPGRINAGTEAGSSSTAAQSAASKNSKPTRRHFIRGGRAIHICGSKIGDAMGTDNNCEDFYDLEAKKLDGTTVRMLENLSFMSYV